MAPPREHVGGFEHGVGEAVVRLVERGGANFEPGIRVECVGDAGVHAFRIHLGDGRIFLFVDVFTPDGDAKFGIHGGVIPGAVPDGNPVCS
jgi:hypothetical protein